VDAGEVLVASGDDEVDDDAREKTVSSGAWSETTNSSSDEGERRLEAAGGAWADVSFGLWWFCTFPCEKSAQEISGGISGERERSQGRGEEARFTDDVEFRRRCPQARRGPVTNFVSLAAMQEGKKGEKVEGSVGYL
jgi:hypothetical protein